MIHLLKTSIKSLNLGYAKRLVQITHVDAVVNRNFGCVTQQYKSHRRNDKHRQLKKLSSTVYWVASRSYGLVQNLLLASPQVKRAFGIPKIKRELENPYDHLWSKIKQRTGVEKLPMEEVKVVEKSVSDKTKSLTKIKRNSTVVAAAATIAPVDPGFFASFYQSLSNSTTVAYVQQGLIEIHDFTGLPWWASIIFTTFLFRTVVTLPLTIYQHKITARIEKISLEMPAIVEELKREAAMAMRKFKWTEKQTKLVYQRSIRKQWNKLVVRDNCHPAKTFIVLWGQIPLWIFQSMALRNLVNMMPDPTSLQAQIVATEMTVGGFGWIPNLTQVDSSYILPVTLALINLSIIEMQSMMRTQQSTRFHNIITNVFRGLSLLMLPIACSVPSALTVYWVASSSYGLVQNLLLASPQVKRAFGIPKIKSELENPYDHLWSKIKQRTGVEKLPMEEVKVVEKSVSDKTKSLTKIKRK